MQESGKAEQRANIEYFEGVNSLVSHHIAKKTELRHAENARSVQIGSIEKREGQTVLGTSHGGSPFKTEGNYGLFYFDNNGANKNLYRVSKLEESDIYINVSDEITSTESVGFVGQSLLTINTSDEVTLTEANRFAGQLTLKIDVDDSLNLAEKVNDQALLINVSDTTSILESINGGNLVTIYYLNNSDEWIPLTGNGTSIINGGQVSTTVADGNLFFVNGSQPNSYITSDGTTVKTSKSPGGHLLNTPLARKINYYKGNLYIGDLIIDGTRKKNTVLKSSILLGRLALVSEDVGASSTVTVNVTDTTYFSNTTGSNEYDVYDASDVYKTTLTVTSFTPTTITATQSGTPVSLVATDNIYVKDSFNGQGRFLWPFNQTPTEKTVKQFSCTELASSDGGPLTMMTNIGNIMFVGNNNNLMAWNGFSSEEFDLGIGCVSDNGFVKLLGSLYFLHYTGIFATSGGIPKLISNKVERYINGATKAGKEACAAGKKGKSVFFTIGDVSLYHPDGSIEKTMSDVCLEYNLVQENWFVHTNVKASNFVTFLESSDSDRLILASTSGNHATKEFLSGETDDGEEIFWRIDLNRLTLNPLFERTNTPMAIIVDTERGSAMKAFVSTNEGSSEFYELGGHIEKGISILKIHGKDSDRGDPPVCRLLDVSFRDSSKQICKIKRASVIFLPSNQDSIEQ